MEEMQPVWVFVDSKWHPGIVDREENIMVGSESIHRTHIMYTHKDLQEICELNADDSWMKKHVKLRKKGIDLN
jgi:hypothetical protein